MDGYSQRSGVSLRARRAGMLIGMSGRLLDTSRQAHMALPPDPPIAPIAWESAPAVPLTRDTVEVDYSQPQPPRRVPPTRPLRRRRRRALLALLISTVVLLALLIPGIIVATSGLNDYNQIKTLGLNGVHHLLAAKDILEGKATSAGSSSASCATATPTGTPGSGASSSGFSISSLLSGSLPNAATVQQAQGELQAAQSSFAQLQSRLSHPDWVMSLGAGISAFSGKFATARGLANAGYDVATMGIELSGAALPLLTRLHGGSLGSQALLTQQDVASLQGAMDDSLKLLADVQAQVAHVNVNDLPVCAAQKAEYTSLVGELPKAQGYLQQADSLIQPVSWLLGVDAPRHFLVQELDSTELRATGGFSGQYGIVTIQNGKVAPFSLLPVDNLDYRLPQFGGFSNGWVYNNRPPLPTYSWWPIANWGLRDSNLNGDFPTDAKLVLGVFKCEVAANPANCTGSEPYFKNLGGGSEDGLIQFTPGAIGDVLRVTGSLVVPLYGDTVTADNLVQKIHYYQLTPVGEQRNQQLCLQSGGTAQDCTTANSRHLFAQTVALALEDRVKHLDLKQLLPVAKQAFRDLQSHDIQMYVTNQALESLLLQHSAGGAITTPPGEDGFSVNHTNWSAGKINDHIKVVEQDNVTLDDKGGATHTLTMQINNYDANIVPGDFLTYWDYIRIYAPSQAHLLSAYGFQSTTQVCTSSSCASNPYPGWLTCTGSFRPGPRTYTILNQNDRDPPLMALGGPTTTRSDVPGRAMWGGNVVVPLGCTATLTLSWYVPNVAPVAGAATSGATPYTDLVQRQGGTDYEAKVILHPAAHVAAEGTKTVSYDVPLSTDLRFTFGASPQPPAP